MSVNYTSIKLNFWEDVNTECSHKNIRKVETEEVRLGGVEGTGFRG